MKKFTYFPIVVLFFMFFGFLSAANGARYPQTNRRPSSEPEPVLNPPPVDSSNADGTEPPFSAYNLPYSIGFEGPNLPLGGTGTNPSVIKMPAVGFGAWVNKSAGFEVYLGHVKTSDSISVSTVTSVSGSSQTETTTFSGSGNPRTFIFGGAVKYRLYQVKYFGLSTDFLFSFTPSSGVQYTSSGTRTKTISNTATPENYTIADSNLTNVEKSTSALVAFGPRFNVEYNFPYVPNLLFGFSTGIVVGFGGNTTTRSAVKSQTTTYTGGVAGTPTVTTDQTTVITGSNGGTSDTYSIGGTGFNITGSGLIPVSVIGTFRIRYAF